MSVKRHWVSTQYLADLFDIDPKRFLGLEHPRHGDSNLWAIVTESDDGADTGDVSPTEHEAQPQAHKGR